MSGSGKGGNNRKNRYRFSGRREESQKYNQKKQTDNFLIDGKFERNRTSLHERPTWTPPQLPENPITTPDCPWCGKQIKEIASAITDKESGLPVHFDCVLGSIISQVTLEANDTVSYIGGGRFGIIHYNNPPDTRDFSVKRIIEWEVKDTNTEWRRPICEYFSLT